MRFSGKLALRVGALGVAAAAIVVPATAAHAAGPSITVTPNTGLHDADVVSVSGSGFANASTPFSIVECSDSNPAATTPADCDLTHAGGGTTDASGNVPATNFTVHEGAIGSNGATCPPSASGGICFIAVSTDGGGADSAIAPITFVTPPSITATPSTGVRDGQIIKVSGKHFPANKPVAIVSCSSATNSSKCDVGNVSLSGTTNASGSFKNDPLKVATTASGGKCKAGKTCFIVATTDIAGQGADKSQDAVTTIKLAKAALATKTQAKAAKSHVVGTVKAAGKGIAGLKTVLDMRKGGHWKKVATLKTHKGGKFHSAKLKSGKYEMKTPKQSKGSKTYGASHSKPVKV